MKFIIIACRENEDMFHSYLRVLTSVSLLKT